MSIKGFFKSAAASILAVWFVVEEMPAVKRVLGAITGIDFVYEKTKDPGWIGAAANMALNPPPGTALLAVIVGVLLIYWTTKPREVRMSAPMIGMLVCAICFAAFGVWYLAKTQSSTDVEPLVARNDLDTHLSLKFVDGPPTANHLSNIWRWYALANVFVMVTPEGRREVKTWNVFLTFDKLVNANQAVVSSQSPLPQFDVKDRESRSAVIAFMGDQ